MFFKSVTIMEVKVDERLIQLRLPASVDIELRVYAATNRLKIKDVARMAIEAYLSNQKKTEAEAA
jgi:hypothetical protein